MLEAIPGSRASPEAQAPELFSVVLRLRALEGGTVTAASGYQTYALFLRLLDRSEPRLADEMHALDGAKPFTVSALTGRLERAGNRLRVPRDTICAIRLTFMKADIFAHFLDGILCWGEDSVEVDGIPFRVQEVDPGSGKDRLARFKDYRGILAAASPQRTIALEFASPTVFRSGGRRNVVFPDPQLVFGSLLARWQAFSPLKMDDSLPRWFEHLSLTRYRLETHVLDFGSYQEAGFLGRCRYELPGDMPEEVARSINALADFAFFCGTGAKTTMGMGQTRRISHARALPRRAGRYSEKEG